MITDNDIKKLKKTFATKKDLEAFATKKDLRYMENRLVKKIDEIVSFFDDSIIDHEKRIKILESQNAAVL